MAEIFRDLLVSVNYIGLLVDDLQHFVTPDWDASAIQKIHNLSYLVNQMRKHCTYVLEMDSETIHQDALVHEALDLGTSLGLVRCYCKLMMKNLPSHNAVTLTVNLINGYVDASRHFIDQYHSDYLSTCNN